MAVPFSAVLEYLSAELLELSGNRCSERRQDVHTINVADIEECVRLDDELAKTFETFSSRHAISISMWDDSDSKAILQSEAVAQFVFIATESSSLEGSCISYLEAFLVEATCACASQTLSPMKVKHLIKQLTSLYCSEARNSTKTRGGSKKSRDDGVVLGADDVFERKPPKFFVQQDKNPYNRESVSLMIAALQLVSFCGAEAVIPFAVGQGLAHLSLRLSPFIHGVCEISDTRR
jgi:hypothetical protein